MESGFWDAVNCVHFVSCLAFDVGGMYGQFNIVSFVGGTRSGGPKEAVSLWRVQK